MTSFQSKNYNIFNIFNKDLDAIKFRINFIFLLDFIVIPLGYVKANPLGSILTIDPINKTLYCPRPSVNLTQDSSRFSLRKSQLRLAGIELAIFGLRHVTNRALSSHSLLYLY